MDTIISNVKNPGNAIDYRSWYGPSFGEDLVMEASNENSDIDQTRCHIKGCYYVKGIRETEKFTMEDYEVFQIIKR